VEQCFLVAERTRPLAKTSWLNKKKKVRGRVTAHIGGRLTVNQWESKKRWGWLGGDYGGEGNLEQEVVSAQGGGQ